jgi:aspartate ammonia-lyase
MCQSTNDVIPSAGKLAILEMLKGVMRELERLHEALMKKSVEFDSIVKIGRTQLQDAVPMRLGQSFHAWASMIHRDMRRIKAAQEDMRILNMGATAIGTTLNASNTYLHLIAANISKVCGEKVTCAEDLFDATQNLDGFVAVSSALKGCAVNLSKMCNDLRLLSSGPRAGFGEIELPQMQNGSSIMPGKVNPVIPEVVSQVAFNIIGNDMTITMAAEAGQMELNAFEPVVFFKLFESISTLENALATLTDHCISGICANEARCAEFAENSTTIATALCPVIGYKKSAEIAKKALYTGMRVKDIVMGEDLGDLDLEELEQLLDPRALTMPSIPIEYAG